MVDALWSPSNPLSDRRAALGITRAVQRLLGLIQNAPQVWSRLQDVLDIRGWEGMNVLQKAKALGSRLKELMAEGRRVLGKVFSFRSELARCIKRVMARAGIINQTEGLKQVYSRQWRTTLGLPEKGPISFAEAKKAYDELMKEYGRDPKAVRDLNAAIADAEKAGEAW